VKKVAAPTLRLDPASAESRFTRYLLEDGKEQLGSVRTSRLGGGPIRVISDLWVKPIHRGKKLSRTLLEGVMAKEPGPMALRAESYGGGPLTSSDLTEYYTRIGFNKPVGGLLVKESSMSSAAELGYMLAVKQAMPRGLSNVESGAGPAQMEAALRMFEQARALARPRHEELSSRGLQQDGFGEALGRIYQSADTETGKLNLRDAAPRKLTGKDIGIGAGIGAGLGGVASYLAQPSVSNVATGGGIGAGLGALIAATIKSRNDRIRKDVRNTGLLLKDYGVMDAKTLGRVRPLMT